MKSLGHWYMLPEFGADSERATERVVFTEVEVEDEVDVDVVLMLKV